MLKEKDFQCICMVLPLIFAYVDKATVNVEDAKLTKPITLHSEPLFELYSRGSKRNTDFKTRTSSLKRRLRKLT